MRSSTWARSTGLTLIELLAALLVLGLLVLLGLPVLTRSLDTLNADLLRWQLHTALSTARNTAIVQNRVVGVCPSQNGRTCSKDWSTGWLLFRLPPGMQGTGPKAVRNREILRHHRGTQSAGVSAEASIGRSVMQFRPDGRSSGNNATVRICTGNRVQGSVVVSIPGRIRSSRERKFVPCPTAY